MVPGWFERETLAAEARRHDLLRQAAGQRTANPDRSSTRPGPGPMLPALRLRIAALAGTLGFGRRRLAAPPAPLPTTRAAADA